MKDIWEAARSEFPLPTRRSWRLLEAGASSFRDTLFHGFSARADHPRRERSLQRRQFGVTHSYLVVMAKFISTAFLVGLYAETMSGCHHTSSLGLAVL